MLPLTFFMLNYKDLINGQGISASTMSIILNPNSLDLTQVSGTFGRQTFPGAAEYCVWEIQVILIYIYFE